MFKVKIWQTFANYFFNSFIGGWIKRVSIKEGGEVRVHIGFYFFVGMGNEGGRPNSQVKICMPVNYGTHINMPPLPHFEP
jgi:hypothetical protein